MKKLGLVLSLAIFGVVIFVASSRAECPEGAFFTQKAHAEQVLRKQTTANAVFLPADDLAKACPDDMGVQYGLAIILVRLHDELADNATKYQAVARAFDITGKVGYSFPVKLAGGRTTTMSTDSKVRALALKALLNYDAAGVGHHAYISTITPFADCPKTKVTDSIEAKSWIAARKYSLDLQQSGAMRLLQRLANACQAPGNSALNRTPLAYLAQVQTRMGELVLTSGDKPKAWAFAGKARANADLYVGDSEYHTSWGGTDQMRLDNLVSRSAPALSTSEKQAQFVRWCDPANSDDAAKRVEMRRAIQQAWEEEGKAGSGHMNRLMAVKDVISGMYGACKNTGKADANALLMHGVIESYNRQVIADNEVGERSANYQEKSRIPPYLYSWLKPKPDTK